MATRIPVSRRRVVVDITVEVLKLPLLEHCDETVSEPMIIEHTLMSSHRHVSRARHGTAGRA
eukprot:2182002-Prymnesium_polylepis.1